MVARVRLSLVCALALVAGLLLTVGVADVAAAAITPQLSLSTDKKAYVANDIATLTVDISDFTFLASSFNTPTAAIWLDGDFDYNGMVDLSDFTFLATNFNQSLPAPDLGSFVPEPSAVAALTLSMLFAARRRRQNGGR